MTQKSMKKSKYALIDARTGETIDTFRYKITAKTFIKGYDRKIKEGIIKVVEIKE